ncbi:DUF3558 domain-containing protein [Actinopolyspora xinjiangensis]|uniref:DUF3558 domain-containing protein n=1 Tax=Actinopolyspora xinjiangensis TaxID=405564 RepID=UPI00148099C9|nr:DUF3558 domain-containing protein [Actinopolyspora xinjiangensis]
MLAAVLCVGVLAGCAAPGGSGGAPTSGASSTESATRSAESGAAIENPKDLGAVSNACTLLTGRQLGELGMNAEPTYREEAMLGIRPCDWSGDRFAFTIIPDTKSGGIDELYATDNHGRGYERTEVADYPAAWVRRTDLTCRAKVGVSADASVDVHFTSYREPERSQPCESASEIAAMVLKNIPAA